MFNISVNCKHLLNLSNNHVTFIAAYTAALINVIVL